ncbi:MAG: VWA domain-containing protein [Rhodobacteraceae bacterium]|nr:VWA domain-containing protein [Paracoccaceae bacterium]
MAGFVAHLRLNGARIGPQETQGALAALAAIDAADPVTARLALKSVLACDRRQWERFDELFEAYWLARGRRRERLEPRPSPHVTSARPALWDGHLPPDDGSAGAPSTPEDGAGDAAADGEGRLIATTADNLMRTDLRLLTTPEQLAEAAEVAERLARALQDRVSRRRRAALSGPQPDLRRTIRRSLASGGEPFDLMMRRRVERPLRVIALVDVSGSMKLYAHVFLAFLKGLIGRWTQAEGYLFHTKLMRVTEALRDRDSLRAIGRLSLMAEGFAGGTKIGGALRQFNDRHAKTALNGRSVVIILSDGYDTEAPERLGAEMKRLRKRARRVVWLNPLLGWRDYAPIAAGMTAALPHVDAFLAANTLERLAALEAEFARI